MTMFGIGPGELLLVLVVALVVVGPQRLPEMARKAGKAIRDLKQFVRNMDPRLLAEFREVTQDLDSVRLELNGLRAEMAGIQGELASAARDVSRSVNGAVSDANATLSGRDFAALVAPPPAPNLPHPAAGDATTRQSPATGDGEEIVGERVFVSPAVIGAAAVDAAIAAATPIAPVTGDAMPHADYLPELALVAVPGD